jgi:hypothetical protein
MPRVRPRLQASAPSPSPSGDPLDRIRAHSSDKASWSATLGFSRMIAIYGGMHAHERSAASGFRRASSAMLSPSSIRRSRRSRLGRRSAAPAVLSARLAGVAFRIALGPTRTGLACVTERARRDAGLASPSQYRRINGRDEGRRGHAEDDAANDEAFVITATFDMWARHVRDAHEVAAALLGLVAERGQCALVRPLVSIETAPMTAHSFDQPEVRRARRRVVFANFDLCCARYNGGRPGLAGSERRDEQAEMQGSPRGHRGGFAQPSKRVKARSRWPGPVHSATGPCG